MDSVSGVCPGSAAIEIVIGKGQPEYNELIVLYLDTPSLPMISRWRLTKEERDAIAAGADIVLTQLTFHHPFQPVHLQVSYPDMMPELLEEPHV